MDVALISEDPTLGKLCREILTECQGLDWRLVQTPPGSAVSQADLYIWDDASVATPSNDTYENGRRHVFLLQRENVARFRENTGKADAAILLKPVTRSSLAAFVGYAAATFQERISRLHSLREDRDDILQCLIQSNLQLQQHDQDRTNFLTRAMHDFRAPLTATGGYCGLLLSEALGPITELQKDVLQRMLRSNRRLSRMASAMFELGLAQHEKRRPDLRPGDIRDRVEQAVYEVMPLVDAKNISISVRLTPESDAIWFDADQIDQVLVNLLGNACKFAPRDGAIEVSGYPFFWERRMNGGCFTKVMTERRLLESSAANSYRIDIRDSGSQIPTEHIVHVFEEHSSYIGARDRSGGGLGLAICRMVVTAHQGHVWVENTELGPQFSFTLPVHSLNGAGLKTQGNGLLTSARTF